MLLSRGERIANLINYILLILLAFVTLFPVLYVLSVSLTPLGVVSKHGGFLIIPRQITFDAYRFIFSQKFIPRAFWNTIIITALGTTMNMTLTILMAYPLSRKRLPGRNLLLVFVLIPMLFSGGLVPLFILVKNLGIINTYWAVIMPSAISTFNLLILKGFFEGLPQELFESAYLDGASELTVLFRIVLPLSKPVLATLSLFYGVMHWNGFYYALMFLTDRKLQPLQVVLRDMLSDSMAREMEEVLEYVPLLPGETLKMAAVLVSVIPLLMVYPFLQRYFTRGLLLGSIKG
jgi:putative aldouronate transport system permease protein